MLQNTSNFYNMEKNPFSLKDFLGYVFPGALALFIIYVFYQYNLGKTDLVAIMTEVPAKLNSTLLFLLLSYVTGHLIAYFSSLTIENFLIWLYGYPSDFLLNPVPKNKYFMVGKPVQVWSLVWRILIALMLMPISLFTLIIAKMLRADYFLTKQLDANMIKAINDSCDELAAYLNYPWNNNETDFHRIISHYEYEIQIKHSKKLDNYIALYGFLRSITLVFNFAFMYSLFFIAIPTLDLSAPINWRMILLLVSLAMVTYIFFLGFMKFYRRYTLENFMCMVIDTSYRKDHNQ